eukprot:TRINITY_DN7505_c0_g3_i1.p1 TRINITY_DN7505_c0_g3~~TRINITY_DN7505_c0_g3_i1.p1  ORF type:complete len:833 (+),score=60.61 TRINITY_DN7505_c0_g3_i1:359-2500(+)
MDDQGELDEFEIGGQGSRRRRKSQRRQKKLEQQQQLQKKLDINMSDIDLDEPEPSQDLNQFQQQKYEQQIQEEQIPKEIEQVLDVPKQLFQADDFQQVREIVKSQQGKLTLKDAIWCLTELAWFVSKSTNPKEIKQIQKSKEVRQMAQIVFDNADALRSSGTALVLWSLVRLQYMPDELFSVVNERVLLDINNFPAQYVSIILYSYAKLGRFPEPKSIIWKLFNQVHLQVNDLDAQGVSNTLWAMVTLRNGKTQLLNALIQQAQKVADQFTAQGCGIVMFSIGSLKAKAPREFLKRICEISQSKMSEFTSQGIALLLWGMCVERYFDNQLLSLAADQIKQQKVQINAEDLNTLTAAFAQFNLRDQEVWATLEKQARIYFYNQKYSVEVISGLLWSFGAVQYVPQELLEDGLIANLAEQMEFCGPQQLVNIMWGITKLQIPLTSDTIRAFVRCGQRCMDKLTPKQISVILFAASMMENEPSKMRLARRLLSQVKPYFKQLPPQEITNIMLSCAKMKIPLTSCEYSLERYIYINIEQLQSVDFAMIFLSMGKQKEFYFSNQLLDLMQFKTASWAPVMKPREISCVVFGLAGRNLQIQEALLLSISIHISSRIHEYTIGDIAMVLFNLGRLEQSPGTFVLKLLDKRAAELFGEAEPRDVAAISKGFAMLKYFPDNFIVKLASQWETDASRFGYRESEAIQISITRFQQLQSVVAQR